MATFTSSWRNYGSGGQWRIILEIDDPPSVSPSTTSVTLAARLYVQTTHSLSDSSNTNSLSGSLGSSSGSHSVSHGSGGGTTQVRSVSKAISLVYGKTQTVSVTGSISGYEALGSVSVSGSVVVPARPYPPPSTPGAPSFSNIKGTTVNTSWAKPSSVAPLINYQWQIATNSSFSPLVTQTYPTTNAQPVHGLQEGTTYYVRVRAQSAGGWSEWSAVRSFTTVGSPAPPGTPSVSRVSDTQHTVTWSRNATSVAPYDSQQVQRSTDGGSWTTVATVSGSSTSYSDTTTSEDHAYRYRVRAINVAGSGYSNASATIQTTPAYPGNVVATKNASNGIETTWTNRSRLSPITWRVERSSGGGGWEALATSLPAGTTSYTDPSPNLSVTHRYRVRAQSSVGTPTNSIFITSNTVQLAAPPNAPTKLGPASARDATKPTTLSWQHNPVDSSPQRQRQIRHRVQGTTTWTTGDILTSSEQSATSPSFADDGWVDNGQTLEWQVRTWGQHPDPSPWSATASLDFSAPPTATISSPEAEHHLSRLTVEWAFFDPEGGPQTAWEVQLLDGAGVVRETRTGAGEASSLTLNRVLPDGTDWTVRVRVQDAVGLWSEYDEVAFSVSYARPPAPNAIALWNPDAGSVTVEIGNPEAEEGEVPAVGNDVYRALGEDGEWELIAEGVPLNTAVTDYGPTVRGLNRYRVEAVSELPSRAESEEMTVTTPQPGDPAGSLWLGGGPSFSQVCRAWANIAVSASSGLAERVLHRFAGRVKPVEFSGLQTSRSWGVTAELMPVDAVPGSNPEDWLNLALLPGPFLLRTPDLYRHVSVSGMSVQRLRGGAAYIVTFTATEVDSE